MVWTLYMITMLCKNSKIVFGNTLTMDINWNTTIQTYSIEIDKNEKIMMSWCSYITKISMCEIMKIIWVIFTLYTCKDIKNDILEIDVLLIDNP